MSFNVRICIYCEFFQRSAELSSKKQSLVTHTRLSHGVTRNFRLSYLPLFPFTTHFLPYLFIYGDIFCTWRKNEAFLSSIVPEQFYQWPCFETMYKKSCSSMSFINFYESIPCSLICIWKNLCGIRLRGRNGIRHFASPIPFASANHI